MKTFPRSYWVSPKIWVLLLAVGLAGFALGWVVSGTNGRGLTDLPVDAGAPNGGIRQTYTCSMHPQIRSTDPGEACPICGMSLIPVPDDSGEGDDGDMPQLRLTARAVALMQIQVYPAERRRVSVPVRLYGRLGYDETRLRTIAAWAPGRLDRLFVDFAGSAVQLGQPMVELFSPQLIAAQVELLQALRAAREIEKVGTGTLVHSTRLTLEASRERLRLLGLDAGQIKRIEQQNRADDRLIITAPLSGVVLERLAAAGDYVETGQPIYRVADLSSLWVELEAYESDLQWIETGQTATLVTHSYPGEQFSGTVAFIDPVVNDLTRTVCVRVDLPNPDGRLKPGMFVRGEVKTVARPAGGDSGGWSDDAGHVHAPAGDTLRLPLVIPATAPLFTGERALVYVQLAGQDRPTFEPREIIPGPRAGTWQIVYAGLREGELVVTNGNFKIDAELQIRGRPSMMQPGGGPPPAHHHAGHEEHAREPGMREPLKASAAVRGQIGRIVQANFDFVQALAADNDDVASQAVQRAQEVLRGIEAGQFDTQSARREWDRIGNALRDALADAAAAGDLTEMRRHFELFSNALTEAVRNFGVEQAGTVYRAVCPMVEGRRGYWLQPHREITNPYFGAAMLRCGEITETLTGGDE